MTSCICFMQSTTTNLHWSSLWYTLFLLSSSFFIRPNSSVFLQVNKTNLVISFNSFLYTNQLLYSSQLCHPSFYFNPPLVSWFLVTPHPHFLLHVPSALFYSLFPLVNIIFSRYQYYCCYSRLVIKLSFPSLAYFPLQISRFVYDYSFCFGNVPSVDDDFIVIR